MTKAIMMIKESSAAEVVDELKDVISKEPVLIKIVSDSSFNLAFGKTEDVTVDLPDNQLLALAMEAHNKDITLNEHINNVLLEQINKINSTSTIKGLTPKAESEMTVNGAIDDLLEKKEELEEREYKKHSELIKELELKKKQKEIENKEVSEAVDKLIQD